MLSVEKDSFSNTLIIKLHRQMTADDVEHVLAPKILQLLEQYESVNILFEFCQDFSGWDFPAIWDEARFNFNHRHQIGKIAVVGQPKLSELFIRFLFGLSASGIAKFSFGEIEKAKAWLAI